MLKRIRIGILALLAIGQALGSIYALVSVIGTGVYSVPQPLLDGAFLQAIDAGEVDIPATGQAGDYHIYCDAVYRFEVGITPYWGDDWKGVNPYYYSPFFLPLMSPFCQDISLGITAYYALQVIAYGLAAWVFLRMSHMIYAERDTDWQTQHTLIALVILFSSTSLYANIVFANIAVTLSALLMLVLLAIWHDRWVTLTLLGVVFVITKPQLGVAIGVYVLLDIARMAFKAGHIQRAIQRLLAVAGIGFGTLGLLFGATVLASGQSIGFVRQQIGAFFAHLSGVYRNYPYITDFSYGSTNSAIIQRLSLIFGTSIDLNTLILVSYSIIAVFVGLYLYAVWRALPHWDNKPLIGLVVIGMGYLIGKIGTNVFVDTLFEPFILAMLVLWFGQRDWRAGLTALLVAWGIFFIGGVIYYVPVYLIANILLIWMIIDVVHQSAADGISKRDEQARLEVS